ncbi:hypothetical protein Dda_0781 [Drechslerella dactyloides]|uniref:LCCL domain-containing protein n=1 Tax=Drechslerella dactyloides TaxID=74499 RepID=A0AAD6J6A5_DREDA|nr:hypothetical protein Dda_0781 [Drechslerella dactyloides]
MIRRMLPVLDLGSGSIANVSGSGFRPAGPGFLTFDVKQVDFKSPARTYGRKDGCIGDSPLKSTHVLSQPTRNFGWTLRNDMCFEPNGRTGGAIPATSSISITSSTMAAPADKTAADMTGSYVMNRTLSGDTDKILSLQGVGWLLRKSLGLATVTINLTHKASDDVINIHSVAAGVISTNEDLHLDGKAYERTKDKVWGNFQVTAQKKQLSEIDDEQLREGWAGDEVIEVVADNKESKWTALQIWGFTDYEVNGKKERRYFRRVRLTHSKGVTYSHMVYDYAPLEQ